MPEIIDMPSLSDRQALRKATARKIIMDLGLDWHKYKREYEARGMVDESSLEELALHGIPPFVVEEFLAQLAR